MTLKHLHYLISIYQILIIHRLSHFKNTSYIHNIFIRASFVFLMKHLKTSEGILEHFSFSVSLKIEVIGGVHFQLTVLYLQSNIFILVSAELSSFP